MCHARLLMLALNSIRGRAIGLIVDYLVWIREQEEAASIANAPEVQALIDARLDVEPAPAVLASLGRRFVTLAWFDQEWAMSLVDRLFPKEPSDVRDADPWCAYLGEDLVVPAFNLLTDRYVGHIDRLDGRGAAAIDCDRGLVHHLLRVYWWGFLGDVGSGDTILDRFFEHAGLALRGYALDYVGFSLTDSEEVDEATLDRLVQLWEWRRSSADCSTGSDNTAEITAFQWWFISGKFDTSWALENLEWSLRTGPPLARPHQVGKHLARLAHASPEEAAGVLRCYELLITSVSDRTLLLSWLDDVHDVLAAVVTEGTVNATHARELANILLARGHFQFREIASP